MRQFYSSHPGHNLVRDDQVEARMFLEQLQGLVSGRRLKDAMAEVLQHGGRVREDKAVVINGKDFQWPHGLAVPKRLFLFTKGCRAAVTAGSQTSTVVPSPFWLFKLRCPPDWAARPWTMESPSPVPLPIPFVVKKGSRRVQALSRPFLHPCRRQTGKYSHPERGQGLPVQPFQSALLW